MLNIQINTMAMLLSEFEFLPIYRADLAGSRTLSFVHVCPSFSNNVFFFHSFFIFYYRYHFHPKIILGHISIKKIINHQMYVIMIKFNFVDLRPSIR